MDKYRLIAPYLNREKSLRAIAGYFLTFQDPTAIHTALVLHQAIWRKRNFDWQICGIPEKFYTDHGSDFTSNHLEQVAIDLKINLVFSAVGVPRGRGKIERFFSPLINCFYKICLDILAIRTALPCLLLKSWMKNYQISLYITIIIGGTEPQKKSR